MPSTKPGGSSIKGIRRKTRNAVLRLLNGGKDIDGETWNRLLDEGLETRKYIEEQVYITKIKDYNNFFREITYRNAKERDAVSWQGRGQFIYQNREAGHY